MSTFADRMQTFTDHLSSSIRDREDARERIHQATADLIGGAQEFVEGVAKDRRASAEELRTRLADFRSEFRDRVDALRRDHREWLDRMKSETTESLDASRRTRLDQVRGMRDDFALARRALSEDLSGASRAWREFTSRR